MITYQQRCAEYEEEEYRTCYVAVVHDVLINPAKRVQHCQSLSSVSTVHQNNDVAHQPSSLYARS